MFRLSLLGFLLLVAGCGADKNAAVSGLKSQIAVLSDQVRKLELHQVEEVQLDPRVVGMAATLMLKQKTFAEIESYLHAASREIKKDRRDIALRSAVANLSVSTPLYNKIGDKEVSVIDRYSLVFESERSVFLNELPLDPILLLNHEFVRFPECETGAPNIIYLKLFKNGHEWTETPRFITDMERQRWVLQMPDLDDLDEKAFERRVMTFTRCINEEE